MIFGREDKLGELVVEKESQSERNNRMEGEEEEAEGVIFEKARGKRSRKRENSD